MIVPARQTAWALLALGLGWGCRRPAARHDAGPPDAPLLALSVDAGPAPPPRREPPAPAAPAQFRLDRRHTGRSGYHLPQRLDTLARAATGARISAQPVSLPDGSLVVGSHDGVVYAVGRDGAVRWRTPTQDRVYTTALVTPASLYVGTDADRMLRLSHGGRVMVAFATTDDADTSAVMSDDGAVYFAAGRVLYRVEADLTVRWRVQFGGKVYGSPAVMDDGTVVIGCQDDRVYAVTPDGTIRWQVATGGDVDATPAIGDDGTVYVGSDDGHLYAIASDGLLRWRVRLGGYIRAGVGLTLDHALVAVTYGPRPRVVKVDLADGHELWSVPVSGPPTADYGIASAPLVDASNAVAVGTPDDAVLIVEEDGRVRVRQSMPADVDSPPVLVDDGVVAVGCDDGALYVLGEGPHADAATALPSGP